MDGHFANVSPGVRWYLVSMISSNMDPDSSNKDPDSSNMDPDSNNNDPDNSNKESIQRQQPSKR